LSEKNSEKNKNTIFKDILDQIDKGILLGAPLSNESDTHCLLASIATKLNRYLIGKKERYNSTIIKRKIIKIS